jgi:methionyl-tRNA formyltransferase
MMNEPAPAAGLKIVFMGTSAFAVVALQALLRSPHTVIAVYTQAPRPAGRGLKLQPSPVHEFATSHALPIFCPTTLRDPAIQSEYKLLAADISVVAAYGNLLPQAILDAFPGGCINIHPSLLPRWRGAAPIQHQILAGDVDAGVTIMQLDKGLDTGDILLQRPMVMPERIDAMRLEELLASQGAAMLIEVLGLYQYGALKPLRQEDALATYARKLDKQDGYIQWQNTAIEIDRQIRGCVPWPGTFSLLHGQTLKMQGATYSLESVPFAPGTIIDTDLRIACGQGTLQPLHLQLPGGKMLPREQFLRGRPIAPGTILG